MPLSKSSRTQFKFAPIRGIRGSPRDVLVLFQPLQFHDRLRIDLAALMAAGREARGMWNLLRIEGRGRFVAIGGQIRRSHELGRIDRRLLRAVEGVPLGL